MIRRQLRAIDSTCPGSSGSSNVCSCSRDAGCDRDSHAEGARDSTRRITALRFGSWGSRCDSVALPLEQLLASRRPNATDRGPRAAPRNPHMRPGGSAERGHPAASCHPNNRSTRETAAREPTIGSPPPRAPARRDPRDWEGPPSRSALPRGVAEERHVGVPLERRVVVGEGRGARVALDRAPRRRAEARIAASFGTVDRFPARSDRPARCHQYIVDVRDVHVTDREALDRSKGPNAAASAF